MKRIMQNAPRSRPSAKILFYALLDIVGMVLFATGALWLFQGLPLFFRNFPSTTAEAVTALAGGLLLMVVSVAKILREVLARAAMNLRKDE